MTPRFALMFVVLYGAIVGAEWYQYLSGFDTSRWGLKDWLLLLFVLLAEAGAVATITYAVDHALPAAGNRAPTKSSKQTRRGSQKYSER